MNFDNISSAMMMIFDELKSDKASKSLIKKIDTPDTKGKALSVEELLKPRYMVILNYPNCPFVVGEILMQAVDNGKLFWNKKLNGEWGEKVNNPVIYPLIFKPLQWYEERDRKDIEAVKYVKDSGGRIYELLGWDIKGDVINALISIAPYVIHVPHLFPTTESDYITQNSKP